MQSMRLLEVSRNAEKMKNKEFLDNWTRALTCCLTWRRPRTSVLQLMGQGGAQEANSSLRPLPDGLGADRSEQHLLRDRDRFQHGCVHRDGRILYVHSNFAKLR